MTELHFDSKKNTLQIFHSRIAVNNMHRYHKHDSYELYLLIKGKRYLCVSGRIFLVREGDVFLIPAGIEHRTIDCEGAYVKFVCMLPPAILPASSLPADDVYIVRPTGEAREIIYREAELAASSKPLEAYSAILKLLCAVLSIPEHREDARSPSLGRMAEIIGYIEHNFTDRITVDALASNFFISRYYLCRLFKEYTGRTITEYVNSLRISKAKQLLLTREAKVSRIAHECGFGSVSAFGAAFRANLGYSPREYKKRLF